jgi:hypothetical protein
MRPVAGILVLMGLVACIIAGIWAAMIQADADEYSFFSEPELADYSGPTLLAASGGWLIFMGLLYFIIRGAVADALGSQLRKTLTAPPPPPSPSPRNWT